MLNEKKIKIDSIDLNIILQSPNLGKYKEKIKNNLSKLCKLDRNKINIKAKTTDRLGIIGENKALACEVLSVLKYDQ
jgi:2-C-methyl-D-erythritol 4-phosphate cytidylyltransferase/2-C-methyl-D-erythritol 2,4-cyclodiphosphate synthase